MVLQKTVENHGSGTYMIEQEVQFQNLNTPFALRETWVIDNDNQMRLLVSGLKEYKDSIRMSFIYSNGIKSFMKNGVKYTQKISDDFFEKYFHFRKAEVFANSLIALKIVPASILVKKMQKPADYQAEPFIRLSRTGGVVNYALGTASQPDAASLSPGLWIEQDQFLIRKIRLPSEVEISAEKHSLYSRGLYFPRRRTVKWADNNVQIQTINVSSKPANLQFNLENTKLDGLESMVNKTVIEEFYKRFR